MRSSVLFSLRDVAHYRLGLIFSAAHNSPFIIPDVFANLEFMLKKPHPAMIERHFQVLQNRPGNLFSKYFADFLDNSPALEKTLSKPPGSRNSGYGRPW